MANIFSILWNYLKAEVYKLLLSFYAIFDKVGIMMTIWELK